MASTRDAFFLDTPAGRRFCILTRPLGEPIGALLHLPAFAEELNKSRRMIALAARSFAAAGWMVLQIDPMGCGDSEGDFSEASWAAWLEDVSAGWSWLAARVDGPPVLWGLRAGALLASSWMQARQSGADVLFWQPVVSGQQHLSQFLRLKAAHDMLSDGDARLAVARARDALREGGAIEVAGYGLAPELAQGLDAARLIAPGDSTGVVLVVELGAPGRLELSPALNAWKQKLEASGKGVASTVVSGASFWQTQEIETATTMIDASLVLLAGLRR